MDSAISRYWKLKRNPRAIQRFAVANLPSFALPPNTLSESLLTRIKGLPSRIVQIVRFNS